MRRPAGLASPHACAVRSPPYPAIFNSRALAVPSQSLSPATSGLKIFTVRLLDLESKFTLLRVSEACRYLLSPDPPALLFSLSHHPRLDSNVNFGINSCRLPPSEAICLPSHRGGHGALGFITRLLDWRSVLSPGCKAWTWDGRGRLLTVHRCLPTIPAPCPGHSPLARGWVNK